MLHTSFPPKSHYFNFRWFLKWTSKETSSNFAHPFWTIFNRFSWPTLNTRMDYWAMKVKPSVCCQKNYGFWWFLLHNINNKPVWHWSGPKHWVKKHSLKKDWIFSADELKCVQLTKLTQSCLFSTWSLGFTLSCKCTWSEFSKQTHTHVQKHIFCLIL